MAVVAGGLGGRLLLQLLHFERARRCGTRRLERITPILRRQVRPHREGLDGVASAVAGSLARELRCLVLHIRRELTACRIRQYWRAGMVLVHARATAAVLPVLIDGDGADRAQVVDHVDLGRPELVVDLEVDFEGVINNLVFLFGRVALQTD